MLKGDEEGRNEGKLYDGSMETTTPHVDTPNLNCVNLKCTT